MPKQIEVKFMNQRNTKLYSEGTCIADILKAENISLAFTCNGKGTCGKCRVKVTGVTNDFTEAEQKHIHKADRTAGIRLACQLTLVGPIELEIEEDQSAQNILQEGFMQLDRLNPIWGQITIPKPVLFSWEAIQKELAEVLTPDIKALRALALLAPDCKEVTLEYLGARVIDIYEGAATGQKLAVAVDIGTTTLAAYLVDLKVGKIITTASTYNPQASYGADVISRISYANGQEGLTKLHQLIISAINQLISELVTGQGITNADIIQVNLVGNSCMTHLLLEVSPVGLGQLPFEPVFKQMLELDPGEFGIQVSSQAKAFILPGIGGFVGSDISAGVLACKLSPARQELLIDIGTNGEAVLSGQGRMLACSTAAGPAFEGAMIACGMMAKPGAITDLQVDKDTVLVTTLDNEVPKGICGTGLIRTMVELLRNGLISETGRWEDEIQHPYFDQEQKRFYLVKSDVQPIFITQKDIRQFQLAKGAMRTGLEILLKRLGIRADELETVYLAGAFGTYLNPADAIFLGLLPTVPLNRIKAVGNTAGTGAVISLLSQTALADLSKVVNGIEHIELAEDPQFTDVFTEAMMF
jgi:uncharacterized 2Fe-2S/4Fe-4S cluster protein (DUF4445 family)